MSLDTQAKKIQAFCVYEGMELVKLYSDEGLSGKDEDRPGLQLLKSEVQPGDSVIVTDLSRFGRSALDAIITFKKFKDNNVNFICLNPNIDFRTAVRQLILMVLIGIHQIERESVSKHVSSTMRQLSKDQRSKIKDQRSKI